MFNKTRRKIVFAVVFSLLALMVVTLATIYISNRVSLDLTSEEMLKTYASRFEWREQPNEEKGELPPDGTPWMKPGEKDPRDERGERPWKNEPEFRLSTFYSVVYSKSGEVLSVQNGNNELQSEETLLEIASSILAGGQKNGKTGNMTYLVEERTDHTLVAMIDGTINDRHQTQLLWQMLIIGSAATLVLVVISIFIARRIVRPLEENDKRQKRFVSDAGHELKTPIAVISANSELLKREIGGNEWLGNIDYENERMSDLVKQLLLLSTTESGELPKETLDFSKLVDGEVLPFETLAFEQGKEIQTEIEAGLTVDGNPVELKKLVSILMDNALSHGTGKVIELTLRREKHSAVLTVTNESEELNAEQLSHLFDRFYRTEEARTGSGPHYGLGLAIAKAVTETHGGAIRADYRDGKAVFTVSIPIKKS